MNAPFTATLDLEPAAPAEAIELSELRAKLWVRCWYDPLPTVRGIASLWGWSKSRTDRFLRDHHSQIGVSDQVGTGKKISAEEYTIIIRHLSDEALSDIIEQTNDARPNTRTRIPAPDDGTGTGTKVPLKHTCPTPEGPWTEGEHGDADWSRVGRDLAITGQAAIAVYPNAGDAIVIRQEGLYGPDEDMWVVVEPQNLQRLIERLSQFLP